MDKERFDKFKKDLSDIRKTAIAVEQSLSEADKKRKAEIERPKYGLNHYEEIIESGKTLVRAALLMKDYDSAQPYGNKKHLLSEEQIKRLTASLNNAEGRAVLQQVTDIYQGALEYSKYLISLRSQWQKVVADLALDLTLWKKADEIALSATNMYNDLKGKDSVTLLHKGESIEGDEAVRGVVDLFISFYISQDESSYKVNISYKEDTQKYVADIDTGGLYKAIQEKSEAAELQLRILKSAVEPFSDFLYSDVAFPNGEKTLPLWFIPELTESIMEYPDAVNFSLDDSNDKYFAFSIRRKKQDGEEVTPEDEKRAVIPDYNQVTENLRHLKIAKSKLKEIFKDYLENGGIPK